LEVDEKCRFRLHENGNLTITRYSHRDKEDPDSYSIDQIKKKTEAGKKTKSFSINSRHYRKIASSSVKLWKKKRNKVIFLTLTFPVKISEQDANICFSKFIDNLKHNFGLHSYIAVKELNSQARIGVNPHFHCIFDIPFVYVAKLNRAWIRTFSEFHPGSANALRLGSPDHGTVVKNANRLVKYICKYTAKSRGNSYKARCIFISHNITSKPVDIDYYDFLSLLEDFKCHTLDYKYCCIVIFKGTTYKLSQFWQLLTENSQKIAVFHPPPY
jgi:hypothetical protein